MNEILRTFENALSQLFNVVADRAVQSDPEFAARLDRLDGRIVQIRCTDPQITWHLRIESSSIRFLPGSTDRPHVIVSGKLFELARWFSGDSSVDVRIDGDDSTLIELLQTLSTYDPEFVGAVSQVIGKQATQEILRVAEMGLRGFQSLAQGVGESLKGQAAQRYVSEEDLEPLLSGIDELRLRVDRLSARVHQQEQQSRTTQSEQKTDHNAP